MSEAETKIAIIIARETFGWHRPKAKLSLNDFIERTGLSKRGVVDGINAAMSRGLVEREKDGQGFVYFLIVEQEDETSNNFAEQDKTSNNFASVAASSSENFSLPVVRNSHQYHERKENKENHTHTEGASAPARARVGSRFSFSECRRYAEHLRSSGQGIEKPGGYATVIYRSGEADSLIEEFLHAPRAPDVSLCPDCEGRGVYYPLGIGSEGGVKKCEHERLRSQSP